MLPIFVRSCPKESSLNKMQKLYGKTQKEKKNKKIYPTFDSAVVNQMLTLSVDPTKHLRWHKSHIHIPTQAFLIANVYILIKDK